MIYKILTRHRFAANGEPADVSAKQFCEQISVTNGEVAQKIVDRLRRQRFTDENGRTRYRYGRLGVRLVEELSRD
jgi:hypothetical protein